MKAKRVLFINQEMTPYLPETHASKVGFALPHEVQDAGREIRTFMPRWGNINERRNQLHEVIRLSGMNIIIDDTDHPLIIKVASIGAARMQVYFIDNDDYFLKRGMMCDETGQEYPDNIERAVFFARGVLETVKKLRWAPDVVHCQGWMSAIAPLYLKTVFSETPAFAHTKVVFSTYQEYPHMTPPSNFKETLLLRSVDKKFVDALGLDFTTPEALLLLAIRFSDGLIQMEKDAAPELIQNARQLGLPVLPYSGEPHLTEEITDFYERLFDGKDETGNTET